MAEKQYKVRLAKGFHNQVASGTRLTNMRHSRGGVTLSLPDNPEYVGPLTKDQLEAIKNDPAFEVKSVSANESNDSGTGTGGSQSQPATGSDEGKTSTDAPETTTPPQGDGSGDQGSDEGSQAPQGGSEGTTPATELPEAGSEGAGSDEGEGSVDVEAEKKALLKDNNRDALVALATEAGAEVADEDTKAVLADKYLAKKYQTEE